VHTLYTFPMACSVAVRMVLVQHQVPHTIEIVARGPARKVATAGFEAVNPKRKVPTLVLPAGEVLTEIASVMDHLGAVYAPRDARTARRRLEWLAFLATELHQGVLGPLHDPQAPPEAVHDATERMLPPVLATLENHLASHETFLGESPDVVDAYATWALVLLKAARPDRVATPGLTAFRRRMLAHGFVAGPLAEDRERLMGASSG